MRKIIFSLIFLLFIFTGCTENLEVRDRAFIQGIAVEYTENGYKICMRPFEAEETYIGEGTTFKEAVKSAELKSGNDFFTGHTELIVIYEYEAFSICSELINEEISAGCLVVYSDSPVKYVEENDTEKIMDIVSISMKNKESMKITLCDVLNKK